MARPTLEMGKLQLRQFHVPLLMLLLLRSSSIRNHDHCLKVLWHDYVLLKFQRLLLLWRSFVTLSIVLQTLTLLELLPVLLSDFFARCPSLYLVDIEV